jgi:arylsulfatase A-like enzyme
MSLALSTGIALAAALLVAQEAPPSAPPPKRNVLLVVVDTLRADHLGCYGYPRATSPWLDRFAAGAVRFERTYTAWPETSESMAAMLSGTWCQTNGVVAATPQAIAPELELLPETLRANGWRTGAFVMNEVLARRYRFDQGSERYVEVYRKEDNPQELNETQLACDFLREHASEPFFVWVHYIEPHAPYEPRVPERFTADPWWDGTRKVSFVPPDPAYEPLGALPAVSRVAGRDELACYVARYDSEIVDVDAKIGMLLRRLDELGLAEKTIVALVADHGEGFGEHDYYWHGLVPWDETAHVPLAIRAPGFAPGVAAQLTSTIDLAPTLLELLGLPSSPHHEGRSLVEQLRDPSRIDERAIFTESGRDPASWQRSVRDRRFKLVHVPSEIERERLHVDEWSLFDVLDDPGESRNVIAAHADVAERLKKELFGWMRREPLFRASQPEIPAEELERLRAQGYGAAGAK